MGFKMAYSEDSPTNQFVEEVKVGVNCLSYSFQEDGAGPQPWRWSTTLTTSTEPTRLVYPTAQTL